MIRVLVIEDSEYDLEAIEDALNNAFPGCTVECAANIQDGHKAIVRNEGRDFDVIITDVCLPLVQGEVAPIDVSTDSPPHAAEWDNMVNAVGRRTDLIVTSRPVGSLRSYIFVPKNQLSTDKRWTERIVAAVARCTIWRGIDEAITGGDDVAVAGPDRLRGTGSIPIATLTSNIYLLYRHLSDVDRERVQKFFTIITAPDDPDNVISVGFGAYR